MLQSSQFLAARAGFGARHRARSRRYGVPWALVVCLASGSVLAAQTDSTISTAAPPATPRIQPPFVVGARPASPLSFSIPVTGQAPLAFSATGLPAGVSIDASSGILSGTAPSAGSYPIAITVANATGSATATLTLVSGDTLSLTPPLGWNSYDSFGASITEQEVLQQAQALRATLQPFGWNYVVVDYRWYEPGEPIDANGRYVPAISKYPSATGSNGFKALADGVHALGLGFGIHIMRGIPRKSVVANTPIANSTFRAADAADTNDPCPWDQHMWGVRGDTEAGQAWYDSIFAQYAEYGIDFIKIDDMLNNTTRVYHQAEVDAIRRAIDKTGRSIVLSLSPGPDDPTWLPNSAGHLDANANMWRIVNDFWDYNGLTTLPGVFSAAATWQGVDTLNAGHWPDTDMLPLGYLGPRNEWHASGETTFTHNEQVTIMSLWSILPSPLMFGGNVQSLTSDATTGPWTLALLSNEEVLAVNQDAFGSHGKRLLQQGTTEVWSRDLSAGRKAVALFNRGDQDAAMSASWEQLGMSPSSTVRDAWQRAPLAVSGPGPSLNVPHAGAALLVITPPGVEGDAGLSPTPGSAGATEPSGTLAPVSGADVHPELGGEVGPGMGGEVRPDLGGEVRPDMAGGTAPSSSASSPSSGCSLRARAEVQHGWGTVVSLVLLVGSVLRRIRRRRQPRSHLFLL
jgi:alpha-galactosidase